MGTQKKGHLAESVEWAKHLRPKGKRRQAKAERQAGQQAIRKEKEDTNKDASA